MKRFLLLSAIAFTAACGDEASTDEPGQSQSMVQIQSTIQPNTRSVTVTVFAPRDNDNIIVTCTSLLTGNPLDARYEVLATADFDYPGDDPDAVTITNVSSKDPVLVYVSARDSRGAVIGEGCADGVELNNGGTSNVSITVFAAN